MIEPKSETVNYPEGYALAQMVAMNGIALSVAGHAIADMLHEIKEKRQQCHRGVYVRAWKHFEESGEREYEEEGYKVWRTD